MILTTNAPIISIKKVSNADFGISSGNQTHIGLFANTFRHIDFDTNDLLLNLVETEREKQYSLVSQLIYKNRTFETLSLLAYINNGVGEFRSPRIRKGEQFELSIGDKDFDSTYDKIKEIASQNFEKDWFLALLGLDTNELVFVLFEEGSIDFNEINTLIGGIGPFDAYGNWRKHISNQDSSYRRLASYLNKRIGNNNIEYYEELEIASQTTNKVITKRKIPRFRDLAKANEIFKANGLKGEEILAEYFEAQKKIGSIKDFTWVNKSKESFNPYDFEIIQLDNSLHYSDAKSTSYKFQQPIIISNNELNFIEENKSNYMIHRLYSINDQPKMRICNNIYTVSDIFLPKYKSFNDSLSEHKLKMGGARVSVPTDLEILDFQSEIILEPSKA